jgi:hypothetical protein
LSVWTGYFSKDEKKFGVLLKAHPNFYYTDAANIKTQNPNDICPFLLTANEKAIVLLPGWRSVDLSRVQVLASKGTETKFHIIDQDDVKTTFVCDAVCSRNFWVRMLLLAKNKNFSPKGSEARKSSKIESEMQEQKDQILKYERERNDIF